jgi:hypothetical protein
LLWVPTKVDGEVAGVALRNLEKCLDAFGQNRVGAKALCEANRVGLGGARRTRTMNVAVEILA